MNCPNCSHGPIPDGARFCSECGHEFSQPPSRDRRLQITQTVGTIAEGARVVGAQIGKVFMGSPDQRAIQDRQDQELLLERVRSSWIEGVLERIEAIHASLVADEGLLRLPVRLAPDAVDYEPDGTGVAWLLDAEDQEITPGAGIADLFYGAGRSLLILGDPGSGKTVTLLQLAREAIRRAQANEDEPIPVVLNLSSWADERSSLAKWIVYELNTTKYGVPRTTAHAWLANNDLMLLLDGLDDLRQHRAACVQAINTFLGDHGLTPIVVCCRTDDYYSLPKRLQMRSAILLESLSWPQIEAYFDAAGPSLANLRAALEDDAPLRELAQSPLILSIMSRTYQDMPPASLDTGRQESPVTRRWRLFDAYIQRMLRYRGSRAKPYTDEQTTAWLSWLAHRMSQHAQAVFLIEGLQPSWLPSSRWLWAYMILSRLTVGLVGGLLGGAVIGLGTSYAVVEPGSDLLQRWLIPGLQQGLLEGLLGGLVAGPVIGIADMVWIQQIGRHPRLQHLSPGWHAALKILLVGIVVALSVALLFALIWSWGMAVEGLNVGMIFGLSAGLLFGFGPRSVRHSLLNDIQTVERISWSRGEALRGAVIGIAAGAVAGAVVGLLNQEITLVRPLVERGLSTGSIVLTMMAIGMLFLGLIGLVFRGLGGTFVKVKKIRPNEGLRLSLMNALVTAPAIGLAFGLASSGIGALLGSAQVALAFGLYGLFIGVLASLWYGGVFIIQHTILRIMLWRNGRTPCLGNFSSFLDYAARCIFLQKVGGGYIFIHRYLQEHFAELRGTEQQIARAPSPDD